MKRGLSVKQVRSNFVGQMLVIVCLCCGAWGKVQYSTGTIVHVQPSVRSLPVETSGGSDQMPVGVSYYVTVRIGAANYLAVCDLNEKCAQLHQGDSVRFRVDKKVAFIKPSNGKEIRLQLLTITPASTVKER